MKIVNHVNLYHLYHLYHLYLYAFTIIYISSVYPAGINGINSSTSSGIGMITVLLAGAYMDRWVRWLRSTPGRVDDLNGIYVGFNHQTYRIIIDIVDRYW